MQSSKLESFLQLVRLGIGHNSYGIPNVNDWNEIEVLALRQGLSAIIVDGVDQIPESQRPSKEILLQWIGNTLQSYEYRFEIYKRAIAELAGWYNANGYKMMVLKGYACGLDWPKPEHRPAGDIDIWLFGEQKEADALMAKKLGLKVDYSHHHHTVFNWRDFSVENHYDFVNVYSHKSSKELEVIFKELGQDDSYALELNGKKVYLPSPNLHALFLIRHMVSHFAAAEITLRQVLDWAFFVEKHTKEVDWDWLVSLLDQFHMKEFYNCINAICIEDLGFISNIFPYVQFSPSLKDRVLADILDPKYPAKEPKGFLQRMTYKFRRWQGNAWKHELCYSENRFLSFFTGLWAKILKPASI